MASCAVLASGNGSNFEAIALALRGTEHKLKLFLCDKPGAFALERAKRLGIPSRLCPYKGRPRTEAERELMRILAATGIDLVVLAGFMKILSPAFIDRFPRIVNIHPALLAKYPGVEAIKRCWNAGGEEFGITIHMVDYGIDTGAAILSKSFLKTQGDSLESIEAKVHELEHEWYPKTVIGLLDGIDRERKNA